VEASRRQVIVRVLLGARTAEATTPGTISEQYPDNYARSRGAKAKVIVNDRFVLFFVPGVV
jgi:hypothetical protein